MADSCEIIIVTKYQLFEMLQEIIPKYIEEAIKNTVVTQDSFLSSNEAVKVFNPKISKTTLHEWTKKGLLKAYYFGGRKFYKRSEIIEAAKTLTKYKV